MEIANKIPRSQVNAAANDATTATATIAAAAAAAIIIVIATLSALTLAHGDGDDGGVIVVAVTAYVSCSNWCWWCVFFLFRSFRLTFLNNQLYELSQMNWTKKKLSTIHFGLNTHAESVVQRWCMFVHHKRNACNFVVRSFCIFFLFRPILSLSLLPIFELVEGASETKAFSQFSGENLYVTHIMAQHIFSLTQSVYFHTQLIGLHWRDTPK